MTFITTAADKVLTIIESPYAGDMQLNILYARLACADSISRGEIPFASHLLYPQFLDDTDPAQRKVGFNCAANYYRFACRVVSYVDLGTSTGMTWGQKFANAGGIPAIERRLFPDIFDNLKIIEEIRKNSLTLPQHDVT